MYRYFDKDLDISHYCNKCMSQKVKRLLNTAESHDHCSNPGRMHALASYFPPDVAAVYIEQVTMAGKTTISLSLDGAFKHFHFSISTVKPRHVHVRAKHQVIDFLLTRPGTSVDRTIVRKIAERLFDHQRTWFGNHGRQMLYFSCQKQKELEIKSQATQDFCFNAFTVSDLQTGSQDLVKIKLYLSQRAIKITS